MKSPEELKALKEEVENMNKKLAELTEDELSQVSGGRSGSLPGGKFIFSAYDTPQVGRYYASYDYTDSPAFTGVRLQAIYSSFQLSFTYESVSLGWNTWSSKSGNLHETDLENFKERYPYVANI